MRKRRLSHITCPQLSALYVGAEEGTEVGCEDGKTVGLVDG